MPNTERPSFIHPSPTRPNLRLPHDACDAHVHVFGPMARFPFAANAPFTPGDASKERLFALHALLGIERCVVVQSTCHGYDNSVSADAVAARASSYCGIALAPVSVTDAELLALNAQGFRGLRFNFMKHLGDAPPIADIIALTSRLAAQNMHLQVHFESAMIDELAPWLLRSATPVVIDHMGRIDAAQGVGQPHFRSLLRLLEDDRMWIKISGSDRITATGAPYADAVPFARMLVRHYGDRTLWGSDWPHPNSRAIPDDGALVDLLSQIAPSATQLKALLVDNPQRLYRFPMALPPAAEER